MMTVVYGAVAVMEKLDRDILRRQLRITVHEET